MKIIIHIEKKTVKNIAYLVRLSQMQVVSPRTMQSDACSASFKLKCRNAHWVKLKIYSKQLAHAV